MKIITLAFGLKVESMPFLGDSTLLALITSGKAEEMEFSMACDLG
jgi:hypothetical protein